MKKIAMFGILFVLISCGSSAVKKIDKPLYEILTQQEDGGANILFFEILSEEREIKMLLSDDNLKKKISPNDIATCNFIILNMGEKNAKGFAITIDTIEETNDKIIITVREKQPKVIDYTKPVFVYPYSIVKINSKKEIVIK
jgi:hypothetical protein